LIAPFLSDKNSVVTRHAAYALRDLGSRAGLLALLRTTNDITGVMGIAEIVYQDAENISGEEDETRQRDIITKLAEIYAKAESPRLPDLTMEGRPLTQILSNQAITGPPLRLDQMLTLRRVAREGDADIATFELPICYAALTNIGTLRLLCDADRSEKAGNEALIQERQRATDGNCLLLWNTSFDPPGQHFLQAEIML